MGLPQETKHLPGYTGFIPGGQHQLANTYGQATSNALNERQANADPLRWRKHVSYAEFTPSRTPAEQHHVPGYAGFVPGIVSENIYSKTYGKSTLTAINGDNVKGQTLVPPEQFKTTNQEKLGEAASGHPGKPRDLNSGGSAWSGASPLQQKGGPPVETSPVHPHAPPSWGISTGKEDPQPSPLLKNYRPPAQAVEPAVRPIPKLDPHNELDPEKKIRSVTEGNIQIPGYSGFVPGIHAENIYARTFSSTTAEAEKRRDRTDTQHQHMVNQTTTGPIDGKVSFSPPKDPKLRHTEVYNTTYSEDPHHLKHVPGYTGFVPGVEAENIYARTYGHATNTAISGDHARYQWRIQHKDERFLTTHQTAHRNFGHPGLVEDKHVTYGHQDANPNRTSYRLKAAPPLTTNEQPHHLPGYGGFVPGVYAKNSYGRSIYQTTTDALENHQQTQSQLSDNKPKSAPDMGLAKVDEVGRMMFKPAGYLFQKRMQGEWNNGRLGAKNMSAIRFEDRSHWGPELLGTTHKADFAGHASHNVPPCYSKYPQPEFQNMEKEKSHTSMYQGYFPL